MKGARAPAECEGKGTECVGTKGTECLGSNVHSFEFIYFSVYNSGAFTIVPLLPYEVAPLPPDIICSHTSAQT